MSKIKRLPHTYHYYNKLAKNFLFALSILVFSLSIGVWGYSHFYDLSFVDSLLNASMILTGMGPVNDAPNDSAKIFASIYAIYSGVAFLTSVGVLFAPVLHRFLHRFHLDMEE
jgi:predicted Kef-type K+ transport protein